MAIIKSKLHCLLFREVAENHYITNNFMEDKSGDILEFKTQQLFHFCWHDFIQNPDHILVVELLTEWD